MVFCHKNETSRLILASLTDHISGAVLTDVFASEMSDIISISAENTCWLVLLQDDLFLVNIDLQCVFFCAW
jgi:hypothetical protein